CALPISKKKHLKKTPQRKKIPTKQRRQPTLQTPQKHSPRIWKKLRKKRNNFYISNRRTCGKPQVLFTFRKSYVRRRRYDLRLRKAERTFQRYNPVKYR